MHSNKKRCHIWFVRLATAEYLLGQFPFSLLVATKLEVEGKEAE